jgi:hypothetical protein
MGADPRGNDSAVTRAALPRDSLDFSLVLLDDNNHPHLRIAPQPTTRNSDAKRPATEQIR